MSNVQNGKAFEYAIAIEYMSFIKNLGLSAELVETRPMQIARKYFETSSMEERSRYLMASRSSIVTMMKLETGFISPKNMNDILRIRIASDNEGEYGDVRDVIFSRPISRWELGFSAKNNNDAVKHSRVSSRIDFGEIWLGHKVSKHYWETITPIFQHLQSLKESKTKWKDIEKEKPTLVYMPILNAFKDEVMRLAGEYKDVPQRLILYLLGEKPFYKVIKDDTANIVIIKAFNIRGELNQVVNGKKPMYKTKEVYLPTRIIDFDYKINNSGIKSENTLNMILDFGWEISFRIHSASTFVEPSLKFDVQMLGNPPILFTQYIFQE
ncbi:HaeIII family restriction endonuclease [uncultured Rikenella sp.]|uniref:HaeIII family restriction endonuclease n=1 Tax=uncultured Rikenella sp. TaxID=368003 RepID=UPI002604753E|nr:HaeIII family restriction endonuclease [uncultured Rikenella sp.]